MTIRGRNFLCGGRRVIIVEFIAGLRGEIKNAPGALENENFADSAVRKLSARTNA